MGFISRSISLPRSKDVDAPSIDVTCTAFPLLEIVDFLIFETKEPEIARGRDFVRDRGLGSRWSMRVVGDCSVGDSVVKLRKECGAVFAFGVLELGEDEDGEGCWLRRDGPAGE
jgi:hypothetical protein